MSGRNFTAANGYRYGFNGKENDNEVKGNGNQQDYGMRIYDPRLGRFLSVDPLFKTFPWYTPYQYAGNKPIWAVDLDGAEEIIHNTYTWNGIPWLTITTSVLEGDRAEGHKQTVDGNLEYISFTHDKVKPSNYDLKQHAPRDWKPEQVKSVSTNPNGDEKYFAKEVHKDNTDDFYSIPVSKEMSMQFLPNRTETAEKLEDNPKVQMVAVALLKFDNLSLTITGSASSGGNKEKNGAIALQRATNYQEAIVKILKKGGAKPEEISKVVGRIKVTSSVADGPNDIKDQNTKLQVTGDLQKAVQSTKVKNRER